MNGYYLADADDVAGRPSAAPGGATVRPVTETDIPALAELYVRAYGPPRAGTLDGAVAEMRSAFDGEWGVLWPDASPAAWVGGAMAGAVQSVRRPSWPGAPDCPWLIDVFTDPRRRRAGLARALIVAACRVIAAAGERYVGLTADDQNTAALTLYQSLGFKETS
jgi:ribosomal protein S18 acetylase RimI-like enzyme